jgi:hypothetical protein
MPIPTYLVGIPGDECDCGRRKSVRHCPACGSSRLFGYAQPQWHKDVYGNMEQTQLYRCIACAHRFTDKERVYCDAPPISTPLARQKMEAVRQAKEQGEPLRPNDAKLADVVNEIIGNPTNVTVRLKNTWNALRNAYIDAKLSQPMTEFLQEQLRGINMPQVEIDQILKWQQEETERASTTNS